jgi:hypothetical protein
MKFQLLTIPNIGALGLQDSPPFYASFPVEAGCITGRNDMLFMTNSRAVDETMFCNNFRSFTMQHAYKPSQVVLQSIVLDARCAADECRCRVQLLNQARTDHEVHLGVV